MSSKPKEFFDKEYFRRHDKTYYPINFLRDRIIIWFLKRLIPPGGRILEIGCGTGNLIGRLKKDYEVYGTDISPLAIRVTRRKICEPNRIWMGDIIRENLPFQFFDGVVAVNVFEHIKEIERAFRNVANALKENGYLFLHLPTQNNIFSSLVLKFFYRDPTHVFIPKVTDLKILLKKTGFILTDSYPATILLFLLKSELLIRSLPIYFGIFRKSVLLGSS